MLKILYSTSPETLNLQDACPQMTHVIKWSNCGHLIFTHADVEDDCAETDVPSVRMIIEKYFEEPLLGYYQFLCDIKAAAPQLLFNSCSCRIFICSGSIQCVGNLQSQVLCCRCYTSCVMDIQLQSSNHSLWMMMTRTV
jgi:hypothetical protein